MGTVRQIVLWLGLAAIVALIVLSIYGALVGAEAAKSLFNSIPLVGFWGILATLLAVGFVAFPRLVHSPPALLMHLAPLFIVAGAMWGSDKAHEVRQTVGRALMPAAANLLGPVKADQVLNGWFEVGKVPSGQMALHEGEEDNRILDRDSREVAAELPFRVRLRKFAIDYYPPRDERWRLVAALPVFDAAGTLVNERQDPLKWTADREIGIPETPIRLRVLRYLPAAAPVFEKGRRPYVEIATPDGQMFALPGEAGREAEIRQPPLKVRVEKVYENLRVQGAGAERQLVDAPGDGSNPAVAVTLTAPDGTSRTRYLMALVPMHGQTGDGLLMRYVLPQPTGARPDPESKVPAMEVRLTAAGQSHRIWLLPQEGDRRAGISLASLMPAGAEGTSADDRAAPAIYLVAPRQDVKAYNSDVEIVQDYRRMAHKVVRVNHPLHYGGYHFYQHSWGEQGGPYSVLSAVSDSGLWTVYVGFGMLVVAAFWRMWLAPAYRRLTSGRSGNANVKC